MVKYPPRAVVKYPPRAVVKYAPRAVVKYFLIPLEIFINDYYDEFENRIDYLFIHNETP